MIASISGSLEMSKDCFYFRYQVLFPLLTTCEYSLLFRQSGISFLFFCFGVGFYRCMLYYFLSATEFSVADYDSTPCGVVRRRCRCRRWRDRSN